MSSSNLFGIESIKISTQKRVEQFTRWQRFVLKMIKIVFPEKYEFQFTIRIYKASFFLPNHMIILGNEASPSFRVIARDPNDESKRTWLIIPNKSLTLEEAKHIIQHKSGFLWASACPETPFIRNRPLSDAKAWGKTDLIKK